MHARPCFYCIVLLTALFISSCYWQPLPVDSTLSTPWSANITTFSDALNVYTPDFEFHNRPDNNSNVNDNKPSVVRLMDRCWCDFSTGSFFEPYNVSAWEYASVKKFKKELLLGRERVTEKEREQEVKQDGTVLERTSESTGFEAPTLPPPRVTTVASTKEKKDTLETLRSVFWRAPSIGTKLPNSPPSSVRTETPMKDESRSVTPWQFDLEPYGFDLVLDFRWTRQPS